MKMQGRILFQKSDLFSQPSTVIIVKYESYDTNLTKIYNLCKCAITIPIVLERNPQLFLRISHVESCLRSLNEKHTIFTDISRLI